MPLHGLHTLLWLAAALAATTLPAVGALLSPSPSCQRRCGSVDIPYPFGIGPDSPDHCAAPGFNLSCENTGDGIFKPFIYNVEVVEILLQQAQARMRMTISSFCYNTSTRAMNNQNSRSLNLTSTPYRFSDTGNKFTVVGCRTLAYIGDQDDVGRYMSGCVAVCRGGDVMALSDGSCSGIGCCQTAIPKGLKYYKVWFATGFNTTGIYNISRCSYAALVEASNFTFHKEYATSRAFVKDYGDRPPLLVDWALGGNDTCEEAQKKPDTFACVSSNSECLNSSNGPGYICHCSNGFQGNPYLVGGCQDINECERLNEYPCRGVCRNTLGSYECKCPSGSHSSDPFKETCNPNFPLGAQVAIGALGGLFIIVVLVSILLVRKAKREMYECFKRNGGQILEEVGNIKLFRKEELRPILKVTNLIGQGGFGQVYKGHIGDISQPVAVKKPKITAVKMTKDVAVTESKRDGSSQKNQFANEVIIQSRISHQNIVKLIGCCLEVEMPILVYELVTQGSLDDILHGSSRRALDIYQRLDIAMQSADGLAYMHSQKTPVLHGDVKSSNILLHDGFVPKISDFGISRLITLDKQYTMNVIGDLSYVDPVYLQSGLLTSKSDVYSFGIVLLEIITRKQASVSDNYILFRNFDACTKEKRVIELVDPEIGIAENIELLESLAGMILKCLNLNVDQRPEMSDLAKFLGDMLKRSQCNKNNIV